MTREGGEAGRKSGLLLFKMCLLGIWHGLIDKKLEDRVNDSIPFNRFCGLSLEDHVPDHGIVSQFRTMLTMQEGLACATRRGEPAVAGERPAGEEQHHHGRIDHRDPNKPKGKTC